MPRGFSKIHYVVSGSNEKISLDASLLESKPPIKYILFLPAINACFDLLPGYFPFGGI